MSWSDAVALTKEPQPTTYGVVAAGIAHAVAVIVIFSPNDEARLSREFAANDKDPELTVAGQPRQNVLLEAGMAFGTAPTRTIFVQSARTRPISDIQGFNWVNLDGK